ncbi:MAG TPA: hypothetical protein VFE47_22835 [Tepidisphaeraceae bacterium]|nr:hypothetical protein [Tepidisphaeraceae bacterium]
MISLILSARRDSTVMLSANKMRQLSMGLLMYCSAHDGKWPEKLEEIQELVGGAQAFQMLMANPTNHQSPGYIYEKPATKLADMKDPSGVAVLHEGSNGKSDPNGFVAYADGHVAREAK